MSILPAVVCVTSAKHDGKYLSYEAQPTGYGVHEQLSFLEVQVTDPVAQYDVIPSVRAEGEGEGDHLVHLRSRYNNKFLVRWSPVHNFIAASAEELNEDETNWGCTLFKPSFVDGDSTKIRLFHVQSGSYTFAEDYPICLALGESEDTSPDLADVFSVVDGTSLLKIPKNIAFKGGNGKYLGPFLYNGTKYLQFEYEDPSDPKVAHEVLSSNGGTVTIKSKYYGQFWRLDTDRYIVADVDEPVISDASSLFRFTVFDVNAVALRNCKWECYCTQETELNGELESLLRCGETNAYESTLEVTDLGQ